MLETIRDLLETNLRIRYASKFNNATNEFGRIRLDRNVSIDQVGEFLNKFLRIRSHILPRVSQRYGSDVNWPRDERLLRENYGKNRRKSKRSQEFSDNHWFRRSDNGFFSANVGRFHQRALIYKRRIISWPWKSPASALIRQGRFQIKSRSASIWGIRETYKRNRKEWERLYLSCTTAELAVGRRKLSALPIKCSRIAATHIGTPPLLVAAA